MAHTRTAVPARISANVSKVTRKKEPVFAVRICLRQEVKHVAAAAAAAAVAAVVARKSGVRSREGGALEADGRRKHLKREEGERGVG